MRRNIKNNKGFSLVELLAVIVIIGILAMVSVPAVNSIIFNSRADTYANTAESFIESARRFVADGTFKVKQYDTTYYIDANNLVDDELGSSPFAPWNQAYVAVTRDPDNTYRFYWVSSDKSGWRIDLTEEGKISKGSVYQGDTEINYREPIGSRDKIIVYNKDGQRVEEMPFYEMTIEEARECYSFKELSSTEIMLTYYNKDCGLDVVIPGKVGGKKVTSINSYTFNSMGITSVFIPDSVKTIGSRAFAYNNLKSVRIPKSVTQISDEAFLSNKINYLVIDEGITSLGARSFRHNQLTQMVIPNSVTTIGSCAYCDNPIPNASFLYVKRADGTYDYSRIRGYMGDLSEFPDKVFRIPATMLDEDENTIPLKIIESSAFSRISLQGWEVVIPDTVTKINSSAFWDSGIVKINIPDGVTTIGSSAFYNNKITSFVIPDSVTSIGELAFNTNSVTNLDEAWIYKRTSSGIDYSTIVGYAGANRNNVVIPAEKNGVPLTEIAAGALKYLSLRGSLKIPSTVKKIGSQAFCLNYVSSVDNGDGVSSPGIVYARKADGSIDYTNILTYANSGTDVVIPAGVKTISPSAFFYTNIKSVVLPEGLETIGSAAFQNCKLKDKVLIPSSVTSIGSNAFRKEIVYTNYNSELTKIVNKTGRSFDWKSITGGPTNATFVTGTVENWFGNIEVVSE